MESIKFHADYQLPCAHLSDGEYLNSYEYINGIIRDPDVWPEMEQHRESSRILMGIAHLREEVDSSIFELSHPDDDAREIVLMGKLHADLSKYLKAIDNLKYLNQSPPIF